MTATPGNPFGPITTTGACLVCGEAITHRGRGRPRLYCERVRCRRKGARKRAQAAAWEQGLAAEIPSHGMEAAAAPEPGPTYEDGVQDGREAGAAEAIRLVRVLADKADAFVRQRHGQDLVALEQAIVLARRWLDTRDSEAGRVVVGPGSGQPSKP